jgi:hypothetical protein
MSLSDDGQTYGFSKHDAEQLVNGIGGGDVEFNDRQPRYSGTGVVVYGFTLTNAGFVTTKTATANIFPIDGASFGSAIASGATIYDPAGWALGAASGQTGLCILQGGKYYAIQAACE